MIFDKFNDYVIYSTFKKLIKSFKLFVKIKTKFTKIIYDSRC